MDFNTIHEYFPDLSTKQLQQFKDLKELYNDWNSKINLISRKDLENLYERHVLHSLVIAKVINLPSASSLLDIGTGGGFPGIPLAIFFPKTNFHLIDGTAKKIKVVQDIIHKLDLKNTIAEQVRAEEIKNTYDFVTARAVCTYDKLLRLANPLLKRKSKLIAFKGGEIEVAIKEDSLAEIIEIREFFNSEFFNNKYLIIHEK